MKARPTKNIKLKTSLALSKTKPARLSKLKKIQVNSKTASQSRPITAPQLQRVQPKSQIAEQEKLSLWFIPARLAFFFNGLYFLAFAIMSFLGVFSNYKIIKPFFTLPFDTTFSSFFLLEIAGMFALVTSLLMLHASRHPKTYRWFYFFLIFIFLPYHLISNLQKLQIELPVDFQNYLYSDTIIMSVLLGAYLISIYPYFKSLSRSK